MTDMTQYFSYFFCIAIVTFTLFTMVFQAMIYVNNGNPNINGGPDFIIFATYVFGAFFAIVYISLTITTYKSIPSEMLLTIDMCFAALIVGILFVSAINNLEFIMKSGIKLIYLLAGVIILLVILSKISGAIEYTNKILNDNFKEEEIANLSVFEKAEIATHIAKNLSTKNDPVNKLIYEYNKTHGITNDKDDKNK